MSLYETHTDINYEQNIPIYYWLSSTLSVGAATLSRLNNAFDNLYSFYELPDDKLASLNILTDGQAEKLIYLRNKYNIFDEYKKLAEHGITFYPIIHPNFPKKLRSIPNPPIGIYFIGALPSPTTPSVAVIGARECSAYGEDIAAMLGRALGRNKIPLISGMARGIDSLSQNAAINAGGPSFAVLGGGVDICYPKESRKLYETLKHTGGIISEFPPGTAATRSRFALRNRLISGLSDIVTVVEARKKSGTLITVDDALEQGREVYTVPGRITDYTAEGCNMLIHQGAGIIYDIDAFIAEIPGIKNVISDNVPNSCNNIELSSLSKWILTNVGNESFMPADLLGHKHITSDEAIMCTSQEVMIECLKLCELGLVKSLGGNRFKKVYAD